MKAVFADTSFWIASMNEGDSAHHKAQALRLTLTSQTIVTSASVLTEYLNYFASWGHYFRDEASGNVYALLSNRRVSVEPETPASFLSGLELYRQRLDKGYSLTDCISMQIMRRERLTDVLTNASTSSRKVSGRCFDLDGPRESAAIVSRLKRPRLPAA